MTDHNQPSPADAPQNGPAPLAPPRFARARRRRVFAALVIALGAVAAVGAVKAVAQPWSGHGWGGHGWGGGWGHHQRMGGPGFGANFDPAQAAERVDRGVDMILGRVGADDAQKKKVADIIKTALKDAPAMRDQMMAARTRMIELMKAETLDRGEIEKLRAQQIALADQASRRFVQALEDAGDTLSAKQRQELIDLWQNGPRWRR